MCEQYCEYCSVPSCAMCFFSAEHEQQEKESIFQNPFRAEVGTHANRFTRIGGIYLSQLSRGCKTEQ